MKFVTYLSLTAFILIACSSCAPRLAQSPLGPEEQSWEKFIKKYYPEWQAPQTIPPGSPGSAGKIQTLDKEKPQLLSTDLDVAEDNKIHAAPVASPVATEAAIPEKKMETYTVQKNDTLWKVSKKFYGKGSRWKDIQAANADVLNGKIDLHPGMTLKIPAP